MPIEYSTLSDEDKAHVLRARLAEYELDHFQQTIFLSAGRAAADPQDAANRGAAITMLEKHCERLRGELKTLGADASPTIADEHKLAVVETHISRLEREHLSASERVASDRTVQATGEFDAATIAQHERRQQHLTGLEERLTELKSIRTNLTKKGKA